MEPSELRRIARTLSAVENQVEGYEQHLSEAYRLKRWADVIGITGPPGVGKSTLVDALTAHWAETGERVAVLAIDPSSPYSGGAVLGDRIRRTRSAAYANTYFRSLSARGHAGGLSETAIDLVAVMSLFGFRRVIVETVGAGQSDIDIHVAADCTVVLTVPGLGDGVQASKAGLMEIGDVFVVNKADTPGAENAARTIENALAAAYMGAPGINTFDVKPGVAARQSSPGLAALRRRHGEPGADASTWVPPVIQVVATDGRHIAELAATIDRFVAWNEETGRRTERGRERAYAQIMRALSAELLAPYARAPGATQWPEPVRGWIDRIADGEASPLEAARALLNGSRR
jgi:LAO/AO transport system kinase